MNEWKTMQWIDVTISWADVTFRVLDDLVHEPSPVESMPGAKSSWVTVRGQFMGFVRHETVRFLGGLPDGVNIRDTEEYHDACVELIRALQREVDDVARWVAGCRPGTFQIQSKTPDYPFTPRVALTDEEAARERAMFKFEDGGDGEED